MNKKFMLAAALAVTTFSAGLAGSVASASQAPAPIVAEQQHSKKDVKPHKAEPQKKDVKKHDKKTANEKPVKPQQDKKQLPPQAR
ncbi:hypothetical protein [Selenomonas ruminantium]|uniref:Acid shock protein n=1 Tax=Selenomonas ruminantium TaxID=971 RepID=A0A1I0W904_SELRU|nr:hypothetical protein [Selenomonas ruminantium]SFA85081.1 hypothetical protein SAMN05216587_102305 [Selenomonas ruminantium]